MDLDLARVKIYTTQIGYPVWRNGSDLHGISRENVIDITVKSAEPEIKAAFAPTWDMVMGYKQGRITKAEYTDLYLKKIDYSVGNKREILLELAKHNKIVFACYCRPMEFCHRRLLAVYLTQFGAEYMGEI